LSHVLYRLEYWQSLSCGSSTIADLAGPGIGNPFGVVIDGTHISVGAEYAHYCARRVQEGLRPGPATIAEIAGGYGGMAYYLLLNRPDTRYVNFDFPEKLALASYYLMKAFPHLRCLCYGEKALTPESIADADIVLLPRGELAAFPSQSVDLIFTSHGMSDLSLGEMDQYLNDICHAASANLLLMSNVRVSEMISTLMPKQPFSLVESRSSGWHSYKVSGAGVRDRAGLASSMTTEQNYVRDSSGNGALVVAKEPRT
jgi:putative sugar O-methyltransferase